MSYEDTAIAINGTLNASLHCSRVGEDQVVYKEVVCMNGQGKVFSSGEERAFEQAVIMDEQMAGVVGWYAYFLPKDVLAYPGTEVN